MLSGCYSPKFPLGLSIENDPGRERLPPSGVGGGLKQNLCWKLTFIAFFRKRSISDPKLGFTRIISDCPFQVDFAIFVEFKKLAKIQKRMKIVKIRKA